jgi:AcrR family transcriptional regulator
LPSPDARDRLLTAAAELLEAAQGAEVSTRAITERAGVQAPTLDHHFGSKRGLEDAVVTHGFKRFLAEREAAGEGSDPIDDIREGWDLHVRYGLENPSFYGLIYGRAVPGKPCGVVAEVEAMILRALEPAAREGRLRVPAPRAAREILAASTGVVLTLITSGEDPSLSEEVREAVLARIVTAPGPLAEAAEALDAALGQSELSAAETALMREWLGRLRP